MEVFIRILRRRLRGRFVKVAAGVLVVAAGLVASALGWRTPPDAAARPDAARPAPRAALTGRASVVDGDTIKIGRESIRINGVDAPESRQSCRDRAGADYACGRRAAAALDDYLAQSRPTTCSFVSRDHYGRFVGQCFRADGEDVAGWLVRNGFAREWSAYSRGRYARDEAQARSRKAGIWQGAIENPWEWRANRARS